MGFVDWFKNDCIEDIINNQPSIIVWNNEKEIWGSKSFVPSLLEYIERNYKRLSDNIDENWKYYTWTNFD